MNYFFKYLLPQLLEYFHNDKEAIKDFVPTTLLEYTKNYDNKKDVNAPILIDTKTSKNK